MTDDLASALGMPQGRVRMVYRHGKVHGPVVVELVLWGPRQMMEAIAKAAVMQRFANIDKVTVSWVLCQLLKLGRAMTMSELERAGGGIREEAVRAVGYLTYYDWVGVGMTEEKVWASSEAKEMMFGK